MTKRQTRRQALKVTRRAAKMLNVRSGVYMRKLRSKDADAQMATVMAAEELGIDPDEIGSILEMILEFIKALMAIFDNWN